MRKCKLSTCNQPKYRIRYCKNHEDHLFAELKNCNKCKITKPTSEFGIRTGKGKWYVRSQCRQCDQEYARANRPTAEWKSNYRAKRFLENPIKHHIQERIAYWRKRSDIDSDLTTEFLIELYNNQNGLCYYTGRPMTIHGGVGTNAPSNDSLSLDKLDPLLGYVKDNVAWCCYDINTMKGRRSEKEFYDLMLLILKESKLR